jgi:hypothetical protein
MGAQRKVAGTMPDPKMLVDRIAVVTLVWTNTPSATRSATEGNHVRHEHASKRLSASLPVDGSFATPGSRNRATTATMDSRVTHSSSGKRRNRLEVAHRRFDEPSSKVKQDSFLLSAHSSYSTVQPRPQGHLVRLFGHRFYLRWRAK